jgi:hypothetical protein
VKFPVSILREFGGEGTERVRECEGYIAITGLERQHFPVFSRKTGNTKPETGSPMTASTANP